MKKFVKKILGETKYILLTWNVKTLIKILRTFARYVLKRNIPPKNGKQQGFPKTLQFPITNRCNLTCKTCSVPDCTKQDMPIQDFEKVIKSKLLKKVNSVGINGGEPFLKAELDKYIEILFTLPDLKNLFIISNGILTARILEKLNIIYKKSKDNNIRLTVTFSIDGYRDIHDGIRGVPGAFDKTISTIKAIQADQSKYCDNIGIICTISKYNIYYINELVAYAELNALPPITYQLAVNHARLENENIYENFSVMTDEYTRLLAQEFFFGMHLKSGHENYYSIYRYIESQGTERMIACNWAYRDVTVDASGSLYYCAARSKSIGSIYSDKCLEESFFEKANLKYRMELVKNECNKCIHYSANTLYFGSYIKYLQYMRKNATWYYKYIVKGRNFY